MKKFIHISMLCLLLAGVMVPMVACGDRDDDDGTEAVTDAVTDTGMDMTTEPLDTGTTDMTTDMTTDTTTGTTEPPPAQ